jgi:type I restriction enzyme S subunit
VSVDVREISLHDAVKFIVDNRGKTVPTADNGIPLIATNCIKNNGLFPVFEKIRFVSEETYKTWFRSHPEPGDIIFVNKGTPGRVCLVPNPVNFCIAQDMVALRVDESVIYPKYLFAALRSDYIQNVIENMHVGTLIPHFKKSDFERLMIPVPDEVTQKYIGNLYYDLSMAIELNNQINKTLEEMAQAIFKSWFVDFEPFKDGEFEESELGLIPKGWRVGTLGECIAFINGYAFKSKELLDKDIGECYHVFKMGNIKKGGGLNTEGTKSYIEKNKCKNMDKYILQSGDLLMCMTDMKGNVALLGHTALMNEDGKYIVNQRVGLIRVNNNFGIGYPHLYILTNTKDFIENLRAHANSGVQVNLSTKEILSSKIIIPEKSVNDKFNDIVKPYFDEIFCMIKENQILKTIRETLLPKLISGEIRVPVEEVV